MCKPLRVPPPHRLVVVLAMLLAACSGPAAPEIALQATAVPAQTSRPGVGHAPATAIASSSPAPHATPSLAAKVDTYLTNMAELQQVSGAVLVAKDGVPLFTHAYGLASKSFNVPNQVDTKFNLGSMNKMFTAIAIAQLVQQGKLSFDDPIGRHLPDYPNQVVADTVTIHHLLTHTSGLGDFFDKAAYSNTAKDRFKAVQSFLPLFVDDPLAFEPGTRFQYSNAGYIVLGLIIEQVSGQSYFDYVRQHIYQPAGMTNTDCYELDWDTPNLAIGYTAAGQNNLFLHVVKGGPPGGGFSTVEDMLKFDRALRTHTLLNPTLTDTVLTGKVDMPGAPEIQYGYGFLTTQGQDTRVVGHSGGFAGISARFDMYLDLGYTVVVLLNQDPPMADRVADQIWQLITQP
jgi:D-alanyl-D-alanine carboxypeptidase